MFTPLDLQKLEFRKGFRGYITEEIDEFLEKLRKDYETLFKENARLKEELTGLNEKLKKYQAIEDTLQNALILAQRTSEDLKNQAHKEKEIIIAEAHVEAKHILEEANLKVVDINRRYEELRKNLLIFKTRFINFLQAQLELIKSEEFISTENKEDITSDG